MEPMVNKRLYTLVLEEYNSMSDAPDIRKYTFTNLEYASYNGFRKVLDTYLKVNGINISQFMDYEGFTYDECLKMNKCTLPIGTEDGDDYYLVMSIEMGEIVDDDFMDDFLEDFLKIKKEEN